MAKDYASNWSEEVFVIKKIENTVPWTYITKDVNDEESFGMFYEKYFQKKIKQNLKLKKYLRKCDMLYVK